MTKDVAKQIEKILDKHGVSAILKIPGQGTFSIFQNPADKLEVLELAEVEIKLREKVKDFEVEERINEAKYSTTKFRRLPNYV